MKCFYRAILAPEWQFHFHWRRKAKLIMARLASKVLRGAVLASFARNHGNQSCSCVLTVCSSSSRTSFAFAVEFKRNPIIALLHSAGEDKVVSNIPVTSSRDIDYLFPSDGDGRVVGGAEAGSSSLWGKRREVSGDCPS